MSEKRQLPKHFDFGKRYYNLSHHLKLSFGQKVYKLSLDAGFTCPNRDGTVAKGGCIYCNAYGSGSGFGRLSIRDQVLKAIEFVRERYNAKKYIVYFQAFTNTYGKVSELEKIYKKALCHKDILGIAIGTRPDCIDEDKLKMISQFSSDYSVSIEYGLETSHNRTLLLINRMDTWENFQRAVELTKKFPIKMGTHVIMGLPWESQEDMLQTIRRIAPLQLDGIKIHSLYIEKNTGLERFYKAYEFPLLSMEKYVQIVCDALELLDQNIVIERLTGDPIGTDLYKPLWTQNKQKVLNSIERELLRRDTFQGIFFSETHSTSPEAMR